MRLLVDRDPVVRSDHQLLQEIGLSLKKRRPPTPHPSCDTSGVWSSPSEGSSPDPLRPALPRSGMTAPFRVFRPSYGVTVNDPCMPAPGAPWKPQWKAKVPAAVMTGVV